MFETMVAFNMVENFGGSHFGQDHAAMGYARTLAAGREPYRTRDGHICFMPYTDRHWRAFFDHIGRSELADDERFLDMSARTINVDALYAILAQALLARNSEEWFAFAEDAQIPVAPVMSLEDVCQDRHLLETGFFAETVDPRLGALRYPGCPLRFDETRPEVRPPPRLDQHRSEILAELGLAGRVELGATAGSERQA
jgi:crotonobetainyl-CoA:carnitine CoA-transferase CaiB-like acyl-CoA transferase